MADDKDKLINIMKQNITEKEQMLRKYEDDLRKKKSTIEWIIHTLKSILNVLEK